MKKKITNIIIIFMIFTFSFGILTVNTFAKTKTNKQIVKEYCQKHFKNYKVRYFTKWNKKKMLNRKGKKIVYVEKIISFSSGKWYGYTKDKHYITYNKNVKKNKKVVSYCIFNPKNNYIDDVIAVIDNNKIR